MLQIVDEIILGVFALTLLFLNGFWKEPIALLKVGVNKANLQLTLKTFTLVYPVKARKSPNINLNFNKFLQKAAHFFKLKIVLLKPTDLTLSKTIDFL